MKQSEVQIRVLVNDAKELDPIGSATNTCYGEVGRKLPPLNGESVLAEASAKKPLNLDELVCSICYTNPYDTRAIRTEASQPLELCVKHGNVDFLENALQFGESRSINVSKKMEREMHILGLNRFQVGACSGKVLEDAPDSDENLFIRDLYCDEASNSSHQQSPARG